MRKLLILLFLLNTTKIFAAGCTGTGACFWVGGTGAASGTTHWATISGGVVTGGLPGSLDACTTDSLSSITNAAYTLTFDVATTCASWNIGGPGGGNKVTIAGGASILAASGDINLSGGTAGITWTHTAVLGVTGSGTQTLTTNAINLSSSSVLRTAGTGAFVLADDNTNLTTLRLFNDAATWNLTGRTITAKSIDASGGVTAGTMTITNATITLTNTGTAFGSSMTSTTINAVGSIIKLTNATSSTFAGNGKTYGTIWCGAATCTITGSNTMLAKGSAGITTTFTAGTITTLTGLTSLGSAGSLWTINSSSSGTTATLRKLGGLSVDFVSLKDSRAEGGCFRAQSNSTNVSGNLGWIFVINTPVCPTGSEFGGGI